MTITPITPSPLLLGSGLLLDRGLITGSEANKMALPVNLLRGLIVLVAIGFQCSLVSAQEQQGISGIGAQRCAILTARATTGTNPNDAAAVLTWIEGFISGLNMNAENEFYYDFIGTTTEQQNAQILAYCRNHPSEEVMNAALHLAQNFLAKKPTHPR